uniref:Neur_chan_LBD domain-containing protein n=1 Tax=Syphacia muris TaxID=451379 RepID=A0A0N5AB28_9BILA
MNSSDMSAWFKDYTIDLYLRQFWLYPRLAFDSKDESSVTISIDMVSYIWAADTFFPNGKKSFFHEMTSHNSFLRIDKKGNILRSIRLTVTANCAMYLHTLPLNFQICSLEIESYGYSTKDIIYYWFDQPNVDAVQIDKNVELAHFSVGKHWHVETEILLDTCFAGVTTVLTMTTLMTSANASLPKPCIKPAEQRIPFADDRITSATRVSQLHYTRASLPYYLKIRPSQVYYLILNLFSVCRIS